MGRTIPSFRLAGSSEASGWQPFRRALPRSRRQLFAQMLDEARLYTSASSAAVRPSPFEGLFMAMLFGQREGLRRMFHATGFEPEGSYATLPVDDDEVMRELKSWSRFAGALREEQRRSFVEMLASAYGECAPAMHATASPFPVEALFMGILFSNYQRIKRLERQLGELRTKEETGAGVQRLDT